MALITRLRTDHSQKMTVAAMQMAPSGGWRAPRAISVGSSAEAEIKLPLSVQLQSQFRGCTRGSGHDVQRQYEASVSRRAKHEAGYARSSQR